MHHQQVQTSSSHARCLSSTSFKLLVTSASIAPSAKSPFLLLLLLLLMKMAATATLSSCSMPQTRLVTTTSTSTSSQQHQQNVTFISSIIHQNLIPRSFTGDPEDLDESNNCLRSRFNVEVSGWKLRMTTNMNSNDENQQCSTYSTSFIDDNRVLVALRNRNNRKYVYFRWNPINNKQPSPEVVLPLHIIPVAIRRKKGKSLKHFCKRKRKPFYMVVIHLDPSVKVYYIYLDGNGSNKIFKLARLHDDVITNSTDVIDTHLIDTINRGLNNITLTNPRRFVPAQFRFED